MARSPVFVVGVPRSGTSWVTSAIHEAGWWVGPYGHGRDNPRGFYENNEIKNLFVKPYLADPAGRKNLPTGLQAPTDIRRVKVLNTIKKQGWDGSPWVYKGLKMLFVWPAFMREFPEATWVKVRRKDEDIIDCMENRTEFMKNADARYMLDTYKKFLMEAPGREVWPFEGGIPDLLEYLRG